MKDKISKALDEGGITTLVIRTIRYLHKNSTRKIMPNLGSYHVYGPYSVIKVENRKLLDTYLYDRTEPIRLSYERNMIKALVENIEFGDVVTVVGGGKGVTATVAYRESGRPVRIYEPNSELVDRLSFVENENMVEFEVEHALVGEAVNVQGNISNAKIVDPSDLEECDVLEIDAEGAELDIINKMDIDPRVIVVESHGIFDSPTDQVRSALNRQDYRVIEKGLANGTSNHKDRDVKALVAVKN